MYLSTIASSHRTKSAIPFTPGGTTEMEIHNISGPETQMECTPVSAE
jgi:hypothetical protein